MRLALLPPRPLALVEGSAHGRPMGDKSPKSKQRDQKQKDVAKAQEAARAKSKQDGFGQPAAPTSKGKTR